MEFDLLDKVGATVAVLGTVAVWTITIFGIMSGFPLWFGVSMVTGSMLLLGATIYTFWERLRADGND